MRRQIIQHGGPLCCVDILITPVFLKSRKVYRLLMGSSLRSRIKVLRLLRKLSLTVIIRE
ncbi:hypothetical protein Goari_015047 [Gossypium aridum]|uniref:Uncharacterized protein n=1 Tax=Gossypium aridum TaxID=34290 RepID=A0A7J8XJP8_GOSAI|nr:hypothetical protein [Gossypium aridum]